MAWSAPRSYLQLMRGGNRDVGARALDRGRRTRHLVPAARASPRATASEDIAMARTSCIRNADWVIAWDAGARRHAYLRNADVGFSGNALTFVGKGYRGPADETIDGRGLMVMPGLVDVHSHPMLEAAYRGI